MCCRTPSPQLQSLKIPRMQFNAWCQNCAVKVLYTNKVSLGAETFLFVVSEVQPDTMMKRENAFQKSLTPCLTGKTLHRWSTFMVEHDIAHVIGCFFYWSGTMIKLQGKSGREDFKLPVGFMENGQFKNRSNFSLKQSVMGGQRAPNIKSFMVNRRWCHTSAPPLCSLCLHKLLAELHLYLQQW